MRYLVYARCSPHGSGRRDAETSVERQVELCRQWVSAQGGEVVAVVTDEAVSGRSLERPGLARVLAELRAGTAAWDALVFYGLDRLSRSLADFVSLADQLRAAGKGFASLREHLDLSSPAGRAMLYLLGVFAQFEREMCAARTRDRMVGIAEAGGWAPGRVPWGYRRPGPRNNRLEADPELGPQVGELFRAYVDGATTEQLRQRFGLGAYSVETVCGILRNRAYLGVVPYGGQEYRGAHPALVTPELFAAAQRRLPGRRTGPRPAAAKRVHLLTGLLWCRCGRPMTSKWATGRRGRHYFYYVCPDQCGLPAVPADKLEAAVLAAVRGATADRKSVAAWVREQRRRQEQEQEQQAPALAAARRDLAAAQADEQRATDALLSGLVDADNRGAVNARLRAARAAVADAERRAREVEAATGGPVVTEAELVADLARLRRALLADEAPAVRRETLAAAVIRIEREGPDGYRVRFAGGGLRQIGGLASRRGVSANGGGQGYWVAVRVA